LKRLITGIILAAAPLLAEESSAAEKPGVELWKWLNFAILAGLLIYIAVKQGGPALAARSKEIRDGLAAGERAKAEAEARAAEVTAKLANLEKEIAALKVDAASERDREADRIRRDSQAEIARIHQQVEMEIESAGKQARLDVQRFAAKLAVDLAEQKVRARMSPDVQAALLDSFLSDFPRNGVKPLRTS
jgi:F-type H+-transporting ATPase subunit b